MKSNLHSLPNILRLTLIKTISLCSCKCNELFFFDWQYWTSQMEIVIKEDETTTLDQSQFQSCLIGFATSDKVNNNSIENFPIPSKFVMIKGFVNHNLPLALFCRNIVSHQVKSNRTFRIWIEIVCRCSICWICFVMQFCLGFVHYISSFGRLKDVHNFLISKINI